MGDDPVGELLHGLRGASTTLGMVGAGLVKPPENCFKDALAAFADTYCGPGSSAQEETR